MKYLFSCYLFYVIIGFSLVSCDSGQKKPIYSQDNTAEVNRDIKADRIAKEVLTAMGGQSAYDDIQFLAWNFFGVRDLIWDKWTGNVRIESPRDSLIYLVNVNTLEGKVWKSEAEVTQPDSLKKYLNTAKSIWINDSYWLVMPFKLMDPGVHLVYSREDTTTTGLKCDVLTLTFNQVGDTPDNKYEVYVDQQDKLIKQWAYFKTAELEKASAVWPWDNYREYNGVLLSGDRSDGKGPKNIQVSQDIPKHVFADLN